MVKAKSTVDRRGVIFFLYLTAYSSPISAPDFQRFQHLHSRKIWSGVPVLSLSWSGGGATFFKLGDKLVTLTLHSPLPTDMAMIGKLVTVAEFRNIECVFTKSPGGVFL